MYACVLKFSMYVSCVFDFYCFAANWRNKEYIAADVGRAFSRVCLFVCLSLCSSAL